MTLLAPDRAPLTPHFATDLLAHGDQFAVIGAGEPVTYTELDARVERVCDQLGPDRRLVLIGGANTTEALVAYLAALRGGHPILLVPGHDEATTRALTSAYDPDVTITAVSGWTIDERRPTSTHRLHPDLALLLSTSGSTGSSKLVRLSRQNLQTNAEAIARYLAITPEDRAVTTLPMQYCYGLSVINSHLHAGAGIVLTDLSVVDGCFWDLVDTVGATSLAGVPHTFDLLDRVGFDAMSLPALRYLTQAGGRLHPDKVRRYARLAERGGWQFFVMYGQTEATARMAYLPPALASTHPQAVGVPIPGGAFTIDSPDGDGVGELVYRGPNVMLGYAERPADLALGATVDALRTGDLARVTGEGLIELAGRRSRFLKLFGLRIDLDQIEGLLADHGVAAMCTGDDDQLIVAVNAPRDPAAVRRLLVELVALPRAAVRVLELGELPRLANGKPDHVTLRLYASGATPPAVASYPALTPEAGKDGHGVRATFADILGGDPSDEDTFVSLGGDSLSYVEMSMRLEETLGFLPRDWHLTPIGALAPAAVHRRRLAHVDTSVVLRAAAIVLVVGTHTKLWHLPGGAHTLLGIAGYNFARFQLRAPTMVASIARIAAPSMCWIAIVAATSDGYAWPHALLLNAQFGGPDARWGYWYIEAIVQLLLVATLVLAIPAVRRLEHRRPFPFALAVVAAGLAIRFNLLGVAATSHRISRPQEVLWLFALGWAAAQATTTRQRLLLSALTLAAVPGFFGDGQREAIVTVGLLLVMWVPSVVLPRQTTPLVGVVAGASLYIYLSHWQVYPPLVRVHGPGLAVAGSVIAGVALWIVVRHLTTAAEDAIQAHGPASRRRWRARRQHLSSSPS